MNVDRTKVSFADAEGKVRFPNILKWGELDQRIRAGLWNALLPFFSNHIREANFVRRGSFTYATEYSSPLNEILLREFLERRHSFASDFVTSYPSRHVCLNDWASIFRTWEYVDLFDFLTFFLRDRDCPGALIPTVQRVLDQPWSPYRLLSRPPTVIPAISEHEGKILKSDLAKVFDSKFEGSRAHIQNALDAMNKADNLSVIRESIHAVESAVRDFTGDPQAILSSALRKLASKDGTHKALLGAFDKLYAYTSDENGIRHSLVFEKNENVGLDEAIFFLSACSAFISYLDRKWSAGPSSRKKRGNAANR
jgi:hypothetical protein